MADVRALLAAERQARRISHPFLTYTKSGQLLCNACNLNVKSAALWEGHLRSANHRKNAAKAAEERSTKSLKRKLDDVDESDEEAPLPEDDIRKKPKPRAVSHAEDSNGINGKASEGRELPQVQKTVRFDVQDPPSEERDVPDPEFPPEEELVPLKEEPPTGDDDEMAAFERDIASLEQQPDFSAATITAAPVSAAELEEQQREDKRKHQELEVEDEIDEEGRKLEEEFEAMEELEDRINKLKERREALRVGGNERSAVVASASIPTAQAPGKKDKDSGGESDDDDDVDDWYT